MDAAFGAALGVDDVRFQVWAPRRRRVEDGEGPVPDPCSRFQPDGPRGPAESAALFTAEPAVADEAPSGR